jgi:hypothetical protein
VIDQLQLHLPFLLRNKNLPRKVQIATVVYITRGVFDRELTLRNKADYVCKDEEGVALAHFCHQPHDVMEKGKNNP